MSARLDWKLDGADWPLREASRFVDAAGMRWHVQVLGKGPPLLLLHGTGASTHSWRDVAPLLAERWTVVAPDLPGHGFSDPAPAGRATLPGMAGGVAKLLAALGVAPRQSIGHSAGAAIAIRMSVEPPPGAPPPFASIVAFNGALVPFAGPLRLFSPVAKFLASTSLASHLAAARGRDPRAVARLLDATGSTLDATGRAFYARLVGSPGHVAGALQMMAGWDLDALWRDLPRLKTPLLLVAAAGDRTVPPWQADRVATMVPGASIERVAGLGHLAHEEEPARLVAIAEAFLARRRPT